MYEDNENHMAGTPYHLHIQLIQGEMEERKYAKPYYFNANHPFE